MSLTHEQFVSRCQGGLSVIAQRYVPGKDEVQATAAFATPLAAINWTGLLTDISLKILRNVGDLVIEYGKEHRGDIARAADDAIASVVAWNIPGLPETMEVKIDAAFALHAREAVRALLASVFDAS